MPAKTVGFIYVCDLCCRNYVIKVNKCNRYECVRIYVNAVCGDNEYTFNKCKICEFHADIFFEALNIFAHFICSQHLNLFIKD